MAHGVYVPKADQIARPGDQTASYDAPKELLI